MEDPGNVVLAIQKGEYDSSLDRFQAAISAREKRLGEQFHRQLSVGDVCRIKDLGMGAKYANGLRVRIESINFKTLWVRLLQEDHDSIRGRRLAPGPHPIRFKIYPSNLELAYITGVATEVQPMRQLKRIEDFSTITVRHIGGPKDGQEEEFELDHDDN